MCNIVTLYERLEIRNITMKLCVTGGAGFIGSNFILYWLEKYPDDEIINIDKLTYAGNPANLSSVNDDPRYTFVKADINDKDAVDDIFKKVDTVVHFAAESHVDRSIDDDAPFLTTNILGTHTLLKSALKNNIKRFHHISTDEVFGALPLNSDEKFNEHTPYDPRSPYSAAKAASDHLVRAYHETHGLPMTITNCSNNYGPRMFPEKLLSLAITNLIEGKKVPIYGDGLYVRDWLYVTDHAHAIDLVLQKGKIGETYTIGGMEEDISNIDLIKLVLKEMNMGEDMLEYVKDRPGHDRRYAVDWTKINNELGWKPEVTLKDGLKKMITWYKENENWWKPLKN